MPRVLLAHRRIRRSIARIAQLVRIIEPDQKLCPEPSYAKYFQRSLRSVVIRQRSISGSGRSGAGSWKAQSYSLIAWPRQSGLSPCKSRVKKRPSIQ